MKHWKTLVASILVVACFGFVLTGCASHYTPPAKEQSVSSSALKQAGTLRVGVNADEAPLAGTTSSSSEIVGIDVDVAAAIADQLGVKVQVVDVGSDPATALQNGTVDIVLGIDSTDTDSSYWKSSVYLQTGVALFAPSSTTTVPTVNSQPKVAAQVSSKSSWRVTNLFGDTSLVSSNDLKSAFTTLSSGGAQYVASDAIIGSYVVRTNGYDAKIVALLQDPSGYCVGVSSSNTELQGAITNAVNAISQGGTMSAIQAKWLGKSLDLANTTVVKSSTASSSSSKSTASTTSSTSSTSSASSATETDPAGSSASGNTQG